MKKLLLSLILLCPFMLTGKNIGFLKQANDSTTYLDCINCKFTSFEYYSGYVPNDPLRPFATVYYDDWKILYWDYMRMKGYMEGWDYTTATVHWNQQTKKGQIIFFIPIKIFN